MKNLILYAMAAAAVGLTGCAHQKTVLFNGQDLDGWTFCLDDPKVDPTEVWSVQDGVIHCKGEPAGYLRTVEDYSNYRLHLEWRWAQKPTNSGVLLHTQKPDQVWPASIEAQLQHQNAGDLVIIQSDTSIRVDGVRHTTPEDQFYKIIAKKYRSSEYRPGQWNSYDITCDGDTIKLLVNGVLQNIGSESSYTSGAICLQSEGSPIEFRNIYLVRIKK